MPVTTCPTCGHQPIQRQRITVTLEVRGKTFRIPDGEAEVCPVCAEQLFDLEASRRIQSVVYGNAQSRKPPAA
jgi:YgiT-type zinc finger domain-containing protein